MPEPRSPNAAFALVDMDPFVLNALMTRLAVFFTPPAALINFLILASFAAAKTVLPIATVMAAAHLVIFHQAGSAVIPYSKPPPRCSTIWTRFVPSTS